jgi:transcriptional regulator with XRE-family HTH domain
MSALSEIFTARSAARASAIRTSTPPLRQRIGRRVKERRWARGLTQLDFAALSGVNRASVSDIENGRINLTLATLEALARPLDCDISELLRRGNGEPRCPALSTRAGRRSGSHRIPAAARGRPAGTRDGSPGGRVKRGIVLKPPALCAGLGKALRRERLKRGFSQARFAQTFRMPREGYAAIERGEKNLSFSILTRLCARLHSPLSALIHAAEALAPHPAARR